MSYMPSLIPAVECRMQSSYGWMQRYTLLAYQREFNTSLGTLFTETQKREHDAWSIKGIDQRRQVQFQTRRQGLC